MPDKTSDATSGAVETREISPFLRWHLRKKFEVMDDLFQRYLLPGSRFIDMGCGTGDALVLASRRAAAGEIWGLDRDRVSLETARQRVPTAKIVDGDINDPSGVPRNYFDVVHEFGAAFLTADWALLAKVYLSLLRDRGVLLWELPAKWSTAHISYLLRRAPRKGPSEPRIRQILRTLSPWKYRFESKHEVLRHLELSGFEYQIIETIPLWFFFCRGFFCSCLNWIWRFSGDSFFDRLDRLTQLIWPKEAGYYLVIKKKASESDLETL
jgi:trans-aconitate methyltransferase